MLNLRGARSSVNKFTAVAAALKEKKKKRGRKKEGKRERERERERERSKNEAGRKEGKRDRDKVRARARPGWFRIFFATRARNAGPKCGTRSSVAGDDEVFRYTMKSPAHVSRRHYRPCFRARAHPRPGLLVSKTLKQRAAAPRRVPGPRAE